MTSTTPMISTKHAKAKFIFLRELYAEMKKVVWLSRKEAAYLTALVLIVSIAVGIFLYLLDLGFSALVDRILLGQ